MERAARPVRAACLSDSFLASQSSQEPADAAGFVVMTRQARGRGVAPDLLQSRERTS